METVMPGVPIAPPANIDNTPAVVTPPAKPGTNPEARLEAIKARFRQSGAQAPKPAAKPPIEAKPADGPPDETPKPDDQKPETDLNVSPKILKELGRLQGKVRELEPKLKEFDSLKADSDLVKDMRKLWSGTNEEKIAAIAKLSGKDGLDELVGLIRMHYDLEQNADSNAPPPGEKKLMDLIEAQNKKIEALETKDKTKDESASKSDADKQTQQANEFVSSFIDKNKTKFELCSRPDNIAEATDLAQSAAIKLIEKDIPGYAELSDKDKTTVFASAAKALGKDGTEAVYLRALAEVENEFVSIGKRFSKTSQAAKPEFDPDRYRQFVRPPSKPTIEEKTEELSKNPKEREAQIRARYQARAEAGEFRR